MKTKLTACILAAALVGVCSGLACRADVAEDARKIADANKDAVVTVNLVVETKMSFSGESQKEERKVSAPGTVIDPSGLVVSSLSEIDPTKMFSEFMPDDADSSKFSSEVVDVKIKTEDGTEIPADVVLRDRDLDLAFLRPKKAPETPLKFVDLSQAATPQVADGLVILSRLGQVANRALAVRFDRVQAVVTKPRTFYVVNGDRLGCPVFALDGKPVGTLVLRTSKGEGRSRGMFSMSDNVVMVVLPCSTVLKAAQQAKEAPPEKPSAEPAAKPEPKPSAKPPVKPKPAK